MAEEQSRAYTHISLKFLRNFMNKPHDIYIHLYDSFSELLARWLANVYKLHDNWYA